ncbi:MULTISPECIES: helix-turn-helix domain-containing protein [unclassified Candidatus Paralachnospira]|uniref:helix-turn-helix domain-containing protein n=1 Tax=unclassified Candidatus Paralachnospira TaxID=3099471 RepID=UPI003F9121B1
MKKTISYDKLWKKLIDKKWNRTKLKEESGISTASLAKLGKNANITTDVLVKICNALECDFSEIMEMVEVAETTDKNATEQK